jgi:hypothetical protein
MEPPVMEAPVVEEWTVREMAAEMAVAVKPEMRAGVKMAAEVVPGPAEAVSATPGIGRAGEGRDDEQGQNGRAQSQELASHGTSPLCRFVVPGADLGRKLTHKLHGCKVAIFS